MALADVHDRFVSKAILAEIERMSLPSVSPEPLHIAYFEAVFGAVTAWRDDGGGNGDGGDEKIHRWSEKV